MGLLKREGIYIFKYIHIILGFPGSSDGEESACNAGDPGSTPGLGRSHGEGIGYSLHYSWASLVAKSVKNLPAFEGPKKKKRICLQYRRLWFDPWVGKIPW